MKMKRLATLAALAVTLLAGCAKEVYIADICYDEHWLMTITNKSDAPVVCFTPERANLPAPGKDGGLPAVLSERERKSAIAVPAKSVARITIVEDGEPDIFEEYGVDDVVQFYIFDKDIFDNTPWEEIVSGGLWLAKYSFTAKQLIDAGKSIVYPPLQKN